MADQSVNYKLTFNKDFARKFEKNKQRVELDQLKAKYGERDPDNTDSSSSESEDEDAKELTVQKERDFLKVLSLLKKKDPKIYDKDVNFYNSDGSSEDKEVNIKKPKKPVYLKDFERERLLEKGSKAFVSDDESYDDSDDDVKDLTYNQEQRELQNSFKAAILESEEEKDEGFLSLRQKSKEEKQKEDNDYKKWLKGVKNGSSEHDADLETLQQFWSNPGLDADEQFLRNYILEKGYVDKDELRIPTYDEIVNGEKEDEKELEKQEEFERKFNFRFEEPDAEFIKSYPRTVNASVRQKDNKRAEARKKREERKNKEKEQRREELKRLKNLKRKEIQEKLEKLKEITGNPNVGFTEEDMDGDFDATKYDAIMDKVFNEGYYEDEEGKKPTFDDGLDLEQENNWDEWAGPSQEGNHDNEEKHKNEENHDNEEYHYDNENADYYQEGETFNMDADYDPSMDIQQSKRNRKKRSKLSRALDQRKPVFDPNEKTFEEYFDEYYKLDYEDIVYDLPCRFKYRNVLSNDYGLSTEEVLSYPERELNQWVSVKKMSQYRTNEEENRDLKKFRKLSRDERRKRRTFISRATTEKSTPEAEQNAANKGLKYKTGQEIKPPNEEQKTNNTKPQQNQQTRTDKQRFSHLKKRGWKRRLTPQEAEEEAKKKKLSRPFRGAKRDKLAGLSVERLAAYKMKRKRKASE